jgi:small GTP-binding protein
MMDAPAPPSVKVVLVGDEAVGKTAIFKRLENNTFEKALQPTVGGSYVRLTLTNGRGSKTDIGLWDTAGAERYRSIVPVYFRHAQIVIYVFDLTSAESFESIGQEWVKTVQTKAPADVQLLLLGNKSDLDDKRKVDLTAAQQLSERIGAKAYIETSALNGAGIDLVTSQLVALLPAETEVSDFVDRIEPLPAVEKSRPSGCLVRC